MQEYDQGKKRELRKEPLKASAQFDQVVPEFVKSYQLDHLPRTVESLQFHLRHLQPFFGKYPLKAITHTMIEEYKRQKIGEGLKPITINKHLNNLSSIFKWAFDHNLVGEIGRVKLFPGKMTRSPLPVMPTAGEFERIIAEVDPAVRGIVMLEFFAGLRRSEAHKIRAEDVLLERGLLIIEGKGGKQRIVPIHHQALIAELAAKIAEVKAGYLWVNPTTGRPYRHLDKGLKNAAKRAGVSLRVYHHLMRHGFGTTAIEDGVDLSSVSKVMGHTTTKTTEIYTHIAATHIINQMSKFRAGATPAERDYLTAEEAAGKMGVSVRTVQRMIVRGELREGEHFQRVGRDPRFFKDKPIDTVSKKF